MVFRLGRMPRIAAPGRARATARTLAGAVAALWLAACAASPPRAVAPQAAPDPFASNEVTDGPRVGAPAPGTRPAARTPGTYAFGTGETRMEARGREIMTGFADGAAYLYTADHRLAVVASKANLRAALLSYGGRDWYVACAPGAEGARCTVRVATAELPGRPQEDALRITLDPDGGTPGVCLGPDGTRSGYIRLGAKQHSFPADDGACLSEREADRFLKALRSGEDFQYRYTDAEGNDVRGSHRSWGLSQALALARWLGARVTAA